MAALSRRDIIALEMARYPPLHFFTSESQANAAAPLSCSSPRLYSSHSLCGRHGSSPSPPIDSSFLLHRPPRNEPSSPHPSSYAHDLRNSSEARLSWSHALLDKLQRALSLRNASCKASVCEDSSILYRYKAGVQLESGKHKVRAEKVPRRRASGVLRPRCGANRLMDDCELDSGLMSKRIAWERRSPCQAPSSRKSSDDHHHKMMGGIHAHDHGQARHPHAHQALVAMSSCPSSTRSPNPKRVHHPRLDGVCCPDPDSFYDPNLLYTNFNGGVQELHQAVQSAIAHCKASNMIKHQPCLL